MYDIKHVLIDPDKARDMNLVGKPVWFSVSPQMAVYHALYGGQKPRKLMSISDEGFKIEGINMDYDCILPYEEGTPCWMDNLEGAEHEESSQED